MIDINSRNRIIREKEQEKLVSTIKEAMDSISSKESSTQPILKDSRSLLVANLKSLNKNNFDNTQNLLEINKTLQSLLATTEANERAFSQLLESFNLFSIEITKAFGFKKILKMILKIMLLNAYKSNSFKIRRTVV